MKYPIMQPQPCLIENEEDHDIELTELTDGSGNRYLLKKTMTLKPQEKIVIELPGPLVEHIWD